MSGSSSTNYVINSCSNTVSKLYAEHAEYTFSAFVRITGFQSMAKTEDVGREIARRVGSCMISKVKFKDESIAMEVRFKTAAHLSKALTALEFTSKLGHKWGTTHFRKASAAYHRDVWQDVNKIFLGKEDPPVTRHLAPTPTVTRAPPRRSRSHSRSPRSPTGRERRKRRHHRRSRSTSLSRSRSPSARGSPANESSSSKSKRSRQQLATPTKPTNGHTPTSKRQARSVSPTSKSPSRSKHRHHRHHSRHANSHRDRQRGHHGQGRAHRRQSPTALDPTHHSRSHSPSQSHSSSSSSDPEVSSHGRRSDSGSRSISRSRSSPSHSRKSRAHRLMMKDRISRLIAGAMAEAEATPHRIGGARNSPLVVSGEGSDRVSATTTDSKAISPSPSPNHDECCTLHRASSDRNSPEPVPASPILPPSEVDGEVPHDDTGVVSLPKSRVDLAAECLSPLKSSSGLDLEPTADAVGKCKVELELFSPGQNITKLSLPDGYGKLQLRVPFKSLTPEQQVAITTKRNQMARAIQLDCHYINYAWQRSQGSDETLNARRSALFQRCLLDIVKHYSDEMRASLEAILPIPNYLVG